MTSAVRILILGIAGGFRHIQVTWAKTPRLRTRQVFVDHINSCPTQSYLRRCNLKTWPCRWKCLLKITNNINIYHQLIKINSVSLFSTINSMHNDNRYRKLHLHNTSITFDYFSLLLTLAVINKNNARNSAEPSARCWPTARLRHERTVQGATVTPVQLYDIVSWLMCNCVPFVRHHYWYHFNILRRLLL